MQGKARGSIQGTVLGTWKGTVTRMVKARAWYFPSTCHKTSLALAMQLPRHLLTHLPRLGARYCHTLQTHACLAVVRCWSNEDQITSNLFLDVNNGYRNTYFKAYPTHLTRQDASTVKGRLRAWCLARCKERWQPWLSTQWLYDSSHRGRNGTWIVQGTARAHTWHYPRTIQRTCQGTALGTGKGTAHVL